MLEQVGRQVEEIISVLSRPPCPWEGTVSTKIVSENIRSMILVKMEELLDLLRRLNSSGSTLSVASKSKDVSTNTILVESMEEVSKERPSSIGRDVLLHVVGLYTAWGAFAQDRVLGGVLVEIRELLEVHESTCALVDCAMPDILDEVHRIIVAHVDFENRSCASVSLMQYEGPSDWDRYLRSIELLWLIDNIDFEQVTVDECMIMCRTIALGCKDVSHHVRNMCLEAFIHLIHQLSTHSMLQEQEASLSDILMSCMAANDERCWDGTYMAVSCMIQTLSSYNRDTLLERSIEQAYRNSSSLTFASSWLRAMQPCFQDAGVSVMQYFTMLLPSLLEWTQALHEDVQIMSLNTLHACLRICWPRNHAHAHILWEALQEVYKTSSAEVSVKVSQVAEVIWVTSGHDFRLKTRNDRPFSELTSTVINKLDTKSSIY